MAAGGPDKMECQTFLKLQHLVKKNIKTHRKITIFRIELSTEAPTGEEPFAKSSFYLNKTHIFEIGRARQQITTMGDNSKTAQRLPQ